MEGLTITPFTRQKILLKTLCVMLVMISAFFCCKEKSEPEPEPEEKCFEEGEYPTDGENLWKKIENAPNALVNIIPRDSLPEWVIEKAHLDLLEKDTSSLFWFEVYKGKWKGRTFYYLCCTSDLFEAYFENGEKIVNTKCGEDINNIFLDSYSCEVIYQFYRGVVTQ